MTFTLEQTKNLIYVANSFEEWAENGRKEPVEITEEIPENLLNLFRIFLFRFCDRNAEHKEKELSLYAVDYGKSRMAFGKIKALSTFETEKGIHTFHDVMDSCNKKEIMKDRVSVLDAQDFIAQSGKRKDAIIKNIQDMADITAAFTIEKSVLILDTGIILHTNMIRGINRFTCHAFLFETDAGYLFVCMPFRIASFIGETQLSTVPFILEKWMDYLHRE